MSREHLTLIDRQVIEQMLNNKKRPIDIAKALGKHPSTISREIKAHFIVQRTGIRSRNYNNCRNRFSCTKSHICQPCDAERKYSQCRRCAACNFKCQDYIPAECLPTFSANTIEMNVHRIPSLAEHFVFFNDDFFLLSHRLKVLTDGLAEANDVASLNVQPQVAGTCFSELHEQVH